MNKEKTWMQILRRGPEGNVLSVVGWGGIALAFFAMGISAVGLPLNFDEYLHAHYLWLVSIGRVPHVDFWCHYPALGYVLIEPLFRLLPESIYSVFALRFLDILLFAGLVTVVSSHARHLHAHWIWGAMPLLLFIIPEFSQWVIEFRTDACAALLAILAMSLMFREPRPQRAGLIACLSVLSLLIMPKYVYPLVLTNIAYAGYGCRSASSRRSFMVSMLAGGFAGMVLAQALLLTVQVNLWDDFRWTSLFIEKFFLHYAATTDGTMLGLPGAIAHYFLVDWWNAIIVLLGVAGFFVAESKERGYAWWVGSALVVGVALSWAACPFRYNQYIVPGLASLSLLIPYVPGLVGKRVLRTACGVILVSLSVLMMVIAIKQSAAQLGSGISIGEFYNRQKLLDMVPRSERVVGLFRTHPCFREDQTFVTWDELWGVPKGFAPLLPEGSRVSLNFQPQCLRASLQQSYPATIAFDAENYPSGWNEVLAEFLRDHPGLYIKGSIFGRDLYLRKDLAR